MYLYILGYGRFQRHGFRDKEDSSSFRADQSARRRGPLQYGAGKVGRPESARGKLYY